MSKISLKSSSSGTATFTIESPSTNTDRTLVLPDVTGGEFIVSNASGNVGIGTISPTDTLTLERSAGLGVSLIRTGGAPSTASVRNASDRLEVASNGGSGIVFRTGATPDVRASISATGQQSSVIPGGTVLFPEFKCRAFVNFNGTGTVAIRSSGNVSSITDNGTGDYTVNYTTAMPDANYSVNITSSIQGTTVTNGGFIATLSRNATPAVGSVRLETNNGASFADTLQVNVEIFR